MKGKKKEDSKFQESFKKYYPFITKSTKGVLFACCGICNVDISVKAGRKNDIKRHANTSKYKDAASASSCTMNFGTLNSSLCIYEGHHGHPTLQCPM